MPRIQSPLRRSLAMLSIALLTTTWTAGISIPASAAPTKGSLEITSVVDTASGLGAPVQERPFNVAVRVLDTAGQPMTVSQATTVLLEEVSGPGDLEDTTPVVIPRNGSGALITGATYSQFANGVKLRVRAASGVNLAPDEVTVDVALTAVGETARPKQSKTVSDRNCGAPTASVPNCGQLLLPNGANGHVILSVGSCVGIGDCRTDGDTDALVVTASANLKDGDGTALYNKQAPATLIVSCDKDLCRATDNGVPSFSLIYSLDNTSDLGDIPARPCPAKGVIGPDQDVCVDYVQSSRSQGDIYLYLLFAIDLRASFP